MSPLGSRDRRWWTADRRAAASDHWRQQFPERAAIRDELLASLPHDPCDRCGAPDAVLFVTDYTAVAYVWRCRECARTATR